MKYDWYQSETHVVVSVLARNIKQEQLKCDIKERHLNLHVDLPSVEDCSLYLHLAHEILPSQCQIKIMSTKIEIKLKKVEGIRWNKLEYDCESVQLKHVKVDVNTEKAVSIHKYPTSSHYTRNWDKLEKEVKEEERHEKHYIEHIYGDGCDDSRRAMEKSFYESGGTVLSNNWNRMRNEKLEVKAPDGMEYRKWQY